LVSGYVCLIEKVSRKMISLLVKIYVSLFKSQAALIERMKRIFEELIEKERISLVL
jgi:hypothetical protein